jgi:hypothetical protein
MAGSIASHCAAADCVYAPCRPSITFSDYFSDVMLSDSLIKLVDVAENSSSRAGSRHGASVCLPGHKLCLSVQSEDFKTKVRNVQISTV